MNVSFEDFLKERQVTEKIDWQSRKNTWLKSIDNLYDNVKKWLRPYVDKGLIEIKADVSLNIVEEYVGSYEVRRLDIYLGNELISLVPKGTLIVGAYGRIDMKGTKSEVMLIEPKWNEWKFAKKTFRLEYWNITEESFKKIVQELV